jgi:predicted nucleic acid-binding protein
VTPAKPTPWAYVDTSTLVKRYVREDGSVRARALLKRLRVLSSVLLPIETLAALRRRRSTGDLSERDFTGILADVQRDRQRWELVELTQQVLVRAEDLLHAESLRTLDALHIASALELERALGEKLPFLTSDVRQRTAAQRAGLQVVWVGAES